ncbi:sugar metabolism transcriptional regulator [Geitlerinema sp. P-1104]|jgi:hypothetical protein|uniref:FeoC-like transcriptional regulator n=1 Tax=Cyanophyceae TaxID=3028117 RepID=UPI0007C21708|nr:FeoC-like transcriptional regulator [Geitlerinema sp. P-1104]NMG59467.1 sugar metabolism transcriptional regulator [Geitlerinema sp. P-1104]OAB56421.1 sugar metabolism transcriptional regulator [Phormidium willei BDU 130791]TAN92693.1 MAG: sugar metabolism transcriptional regulator [Phormidium sp. SL48-SHIP]
MILRELQGYLAQHQAVSLADLMNHFHCDGDLLRLMLKKLIRKGRVRQLPSGQRCGECHHCDPTQFEWYQFIR